MMSIDEAYVAMYLFLRQFYNETRSDDIGALLGEMDLVAPRATMDPAAWGSWEKAVSDAQASWKDFLKRHGVRQENGSSVLMKQRGLF